MNTEAQKRARLKYDQKYAKQVPIKLNTKTDADIFCRLDEVGNKQGYIKQLIRDDIIRVHGENYIYPELQNERNGEEE